MELAALDPAWIALIGTVMGTIGLAIVNRFLGKEKVKSDDATQIRDELRLEITAQRQEIKDLEVSVDKWRDEYYELYLKYAALRTELTLALKEIGVRTENAKEQVAGIDESLPPVTSS